MGGYFDHVWCDVLPMDVARILLGCPWLYDMDVIHHDRANIYSFKHGGRTIELIPTKPVEKDSPSKQKVSSPPPNLQSLHLLTRREFEKVGNKVRFVFALIP